MYESYWGLNARPFDQRADAAFYYPSEVQHAALMKLRYALEHASAAALAGGSGTGKTLLLDLLAGQVREQPLVFIRIAFPLLSYAEILAYIASEVAGDRPAPEPTTPPVDRSLREIEVALAQLASQGKRLVICVDDAHSIVDPLAFDALRLLLNLGNGNAPSLVLVGQTRLLQMMSRMPSLDERLTAKCLLAPFFAEETAAYIAHRLKAAGASREIFNGSAVEAIHALAQGIPRRINRLCDLALLVGFAEERQTIVADQIEAVADDLTAPQAAQPHAEVTS